MVFYGLYGQSGTITVPNDNKLVFSSQESVITMQTQFLG